MNLVKHLSTKSFLCVCVFALLELWGVSGAQDPLFLPAPSCKLPLFPCIPRHPSRSVQTGVGLHHLGLQTHDEECGRHRSADSLHAAAERGPGGGSCPKLLPDLLLRHPTTHLLCGHWHVAHRWWAPSSVQRQTIRHSASFSIEPFILGRYLTFSAISVIGRRVLTQWADRRRRPGFETLYRCSWCFESGWFMVCVPFVLKFSLNQQLKTFCLIVTGQQTNASLLKTSLTRRDVIVFAFKKLSQIATYSWFKYVLVF